MGAEFALHAHVVTFSSDLCVLTASWCKLTLKVTLTPKVSPSHNIFQRHQQSQSSTTSAVQLWATTAIQHHAATTATWAAVPSSSAHSRGGWSRWVTTSPGDRLTWDGPAL